MLTETSGASEPIQIFR